MRLSSKVAYNTLVQLIGKIFATLIGLVTIAIMTRYLGQTGFGQYTTIITFLSFFAVIADFGLTLITAQLISDPAANHDKILSNLFSLRLTSALIFLGLAPLTVFFFPYPLIIKLGITITTLSFLFNALNQIFVGLFQKNLRMEIVSLAEIISRIFLLLGVLSIVYFKAGLIGIMVATVISSFISFLIHYWSARKMARINLQFDFSLWRQIFKKSWPLALTIMFNLIYLRADVLILSLFKSQAEVGIYGAAYKVIDVLTALPFMFAGLILPILTKAWLEKNYERYKSIMQKSYAVMALLAVPLLVGTPFVAKRIMILVAGEEFAPAGNILNILIIATAFIFIGCLFAHAVIAIDKQKNIIAAYAVTALTSVIGYLIFIPRYSYFGAAWVTVYSEFSIALASFYIVYKFSDFKPDLGIFYKSLAASSGMGLALFITTDKINLFFTLALALVTYLVILYLLGGLPKKYLAEFINK